VRQSRAVENARRPWRCLCSKSRGLSRVLRTGAPTRFPRARDPERPVPLPRGGGLGLRVSAPQAAFGRTGDLRLPSCRKGLSDIPPQPLASSGGRGAWLIRPPHLVGKCWVATPGETGQALGMASSVVGKRWWGRQRPVGEEWRPGLLDPAGRPLTGGNIPLDIPHHVTTAMACSLIGQIGQNCWWVLRDALSLTEIARLTNLDRATAAGRLHLAFQPHLKPLQARRQGARRLHGVRAFRGWPCSHRADPPFTDEVPAMPPPGHVGQFLRQENLTGLGSLLARRLTETGCPGSDGGWVSLSTTVCTKNVTPSDGGALEDAVQVSFSAPDVMLRVGASEASSPSTSQPSRPAVREL